jgi:hypothetical protein
MEVTNFFEIEKKTGKARRLRKQDVQAGYHGLNVEEKINSRECYILHNGTLSPTSQATIDKINDHTKCVRLVSFAVKKLQSDASRFGGQFPAEYYIDFAKSIFQEAISYSPQNPDQGVQLAAGLFGEEVKDAPDVLPAYHIYDAIARIDNNNGYDKVQHFTKSAYLQYVYGTEVTSLAGVGKEIRDEIKHRLGKTGTGYDSHDIQADALGQAYGAQLFTTYHPIRNFLERQL